MSAALPAAAPSVDAGATPASRPGLHLPNRIPADAMAATTPLRPIDALGPAQQTPFLPHILRVAGGAQRAVTLNRDLLDDFVCGTQELFLDKCCVLLTSAGRPVPARGRHLRVLGSGPQRVARLRVQVQSQSPQKKKKGLVVGAKRQSPPASV